MYWPLLRLCSSSFIKLASRPLIFLVKINFDKGVLMNPKRRLVRNSLAFLEEALDRLECRGWVVVRVPSALQPSLAGSSFENGAEQGTKA